MWERLKRGLVPPRAVSLAVALLLAATAAVQAQAPAVGVPEPRMVEALRTRAARLLATDAAPELARHARMAALREGRKAAAGLTGYDMLALSTDAALDLAAGRVAAISTATIRSVQENLAEVGFWIEPMENLVVRLGTQELDYSYSAGYILVTLPAPLDMGDEATLTFTDQGEPDCSPGFFGMVFCNLDEEITYFGGAPWVPGKLTFTEEDLADLADISFSVTVPEGYIVTGAGVLTGEPVDNGDGTFTHDFVGAAPDSGVSFAAAQFDVARATSSSGVDSYAYTLPGHQTYGQAWADMDAEIIDFFEARYRDYAYPKIDAIQVLDELGGGFATISAVFMLMSAFDAEPRVDYYSEGIFAHEIGHQWWAYMVPLLEYQAPWLNEGFAEFSAYLYSETIWSSYFIDYAYDWYAQLIQYNIPPENELPISEMDLSRISDEDYYLLTYEKGAYVLRMLRHVLGDETFFAGMRAYAEGPGAAGARTSVFQQAMEETSGEDLSWFFDEWVWGTGWPHYKTAFTRAGDEASGYSVTVTVTQEKEPLFDMPVPIVVWIDGEDGEAEEITHVERIFEKSHTFTYDFERPVRGVQLDPHARVMARRENALAGDVNGSGAVDGYDLFFLAYAYRADINEDPYNWIPQSDLNFDGRVDQEDLDLFAANFAKDVNDE